MRILFKTRVVGILCFLALSTSFAMAAPPVLNVITAAQIAQKDLTDRNLQGTVYVKELVYKDKAGGKSFWEVYWSKRFPANTKGYHEVGVKIKMDGSYTPDRKAISKPD